MAATETDVLLERARALAERSASGDDAARAEFIRALNRLRGLAGLRPLATDEVAFEHTVGEALLQLRDAVITLEPKRSGSPVRPDFVVSRQDHIVLVDAAGARPFSHSRARRRAQDLSSALVHYGAQHGFVVVPDKAYGPVAPIPVAPEVDLIRLLSLTRAVDRALGGSQ